MTAIAGVDGPQYVAVGAVFNLTNSTNLTCSISTLSVTSSDIAVVPLTNITFSGTYPNCVATLFSSQSSGTSIITITARNEYNQLATRSFIFTAISKPVLVFSFRKIMKNYFGNAMRMRRVSDNAEQDIGFDSNGNFDLTAYNTFRGVSTLRVRTWYDQSGNGYNANQSTNANQPTVTIAGFNGAPQVEFSGLYWLISTQAQNVTTSNRDLTVFFAGKATTVNQIGYGSFNPGNASDRIGIHLNWGDNFIYWDSPGLCCANSRLSLNNAANVNVSRVYVFGRNNATQYIKINGTTVSSRINASGTYGSPTTPWYLGSGSNAASSSSPLAEYMQYITGLTDAQVDSITNEQKNYFGL